MAYYHLLVTALLCSRLAGVQATQLSPDAFVKKGFDFIVIGGGTTGLALATRISDNPSLTVGIIEAGQFLIDNNITIPYPNYDWNLVTEPDARLNNRQMPLRRGRILGGTSAINGMVHSRGSKTEYGGLEQLNNPGWNFNFIQSGIKKSENWTPPRQFEQTQFFANNDPQNHGTKGVIHTSVYPFYGDVVHPFFAASQKLGIAVNRAMSSGDSTGIWTLNGGIDQKNVSRSYSANVTKIATQTKSGRIVATGVQFVSQRQAYTALVKGEVIISAGAIQTPQILELSGIGNKTLLELLSIPVKVDLPGVGENFHDHFGAIPTFQTLSNFTGQDVLADPNGAEQQLEQYLTNRTGMYTSLATTLAFLPVQDFVSSAVAAQLKADLDGALKSQPAHFKQSFDLMRSWLDDPSVSQVEIVLFPSLVTGLPEPGKRYYSVAVFLQHPWSRGSVIHIKSANPLAAPAIKGNYLGAPGDFDAKLLIEAIHWVLKVTQTEPLKSATIAVPNPSLNATDAELRAFIAAGGSTEWHFLGMASMLPRSQRGVVDAGRFSAVYGPKALFLVGFSTVGIGSLINGFSVSGPF
ncbi:L-sorbose 1-dehydrogenase [Leucoagaricus sp. SymC.cos]|nr:L-sorbose 1-dehydrogenase [Leucoagaricus sp. SymC.cos]